MKPKVDIGVRFKQSYEVSYPKFCQNVIAMRVIPGQDILHLPKLLKLFAQTVKKVEELEASSYQSANLK